MYFGYFLFQSRFYGMYMRHTHIQALVPGPLTHPVGWNAALQTLSNSRAALSCRLDRASQRRSTLSVPPLTNQGRLGCGARARQEPVCPCDKRNA